MEKILVHITELRNKTNQIFEFEVENEYIHIRALPPAGKKRHVKLWKVLEACRKHGCAQWKIKFVMNKEFAGLELDAYQLLKYARITIKLKSMGEGLYLPYLEAIPEKPIDHLLRLKFFGCMRNKYWDTRPYIPIEPDPKWTKGLRPRVVEVQSPPQLEVPVAKCQSLHQRQITNVVASSERECVKKKKQSRVLKVQSPPQLEVPVANYHSLHQRVVEVQSPPQLEVPVAKYESLHQRQITNVASSEREREVISSDMNDETRIVYPAAALRERIERGWGGNMLQLPQQKENIDDLCSPIKRKDMEKAVRVMLLVIAFTCVLFLKFLV